MWICIFLVRSWQIFWCQNYLGLLKKFVFAFSAPPFSVDETLHVAYKKYKIKRKLTFFSVNTKYISSRELETSKFHLCYACLKIQMFSTHLMKYIWYSPQKSKYPLFIFSVFLFLWAVKISWSEELTKKFLITSRPEHNFSQVSFLLLYIPVNNFSVMSGRDSHLSIICNQVRVKLACSATDTITKLENLVKAIRGNIRASGWQNQ